MKKLKLGKKMTAIDMKTGQRIPEHTSAPWEMDTGTDGAVIYKLDTATIANVSTDLVAWEANARLIAAAPELLDALKRCYQIMEDINDVEDIDETYDNLLIDAKAAIVKAEGK